MIADRHFVNSIIKIHYNDDNDPIFEHEGIIRKQEAEKCFSLEAQVIESIDQVLHACYGIN